LGTVIAVHKLKMKRRGRRGSCEK